MTSPADLRREARRLAKAVDQWHRHVRERTFQRSQQGPAQRAPRLRVRFGIQPDTLQQTVIEDRHPRKICVWGRQRGKTVTALLWIFRRAVLHPGTIHWYVAPTYKQAKRIAWDKAKAILPRGMMSRRPNESSLCLYLQNGSKIFLIGAADSDSLRGPSLTSVVLDEYGTMRMEAWTQAIQPMLVATRGHALFIGTPNALKGPHLEALWHRARSGQDPRWAWWHSPSREAVYIALEEIEAARQQLRPWEFEQEYEAQFKDISGRVWPEFKDRFADDPDEPGHLLRVPAGADQLPCPKGWDVVCGVDFGFTAPLAAVWIAVGPSQQAQVLAEYSAPRRRTSEHAVHLRAISDLYGGVDMVRFVGDPADPHWAAEFDAEGIHIEPAVNAVNAGIERVGRLLAHGYMHVGACCTGLIGDMLHYIMDPTAKVPRPRKLNDHTCDALRYACMATEPPGSFSRRAGEPEAQIDYVGDDGRFDDLEDNWDATGWPAQWEEY